MAGGDRELPELKSSQSCVNRRSSGWEASCVLLAEYRIGEALPFRVASLPHEPQDTPQGQAHWS